MKYTRLPNPLSLLSISGLISLVMAFGPCTPTSRHIDGDCSTTTSNKKDGEHATTMRWLDRHPLPTPYQHNKFFSPTTLEMFNQAQRLIFKRWLRETFEPSLFADGEMQEA